MIWGYEKIIVGKHSDFMVMSSPHSKLYFDFDMEQDFQFIMVWSNGRKFHLRGTRELGNYEHFLIWLSFSNKKYLERHFCSKCVEWCYFLKLSQTWKCGGLDKDI